MNADNSRPTWRWWLQVLFILFWSFGLVAAFFGLHKPASAPVIRGLALSLGSVIFWLSITLLAAMLGRRLTGSLLAAEEPLVRLALSIGMGLGAISLLLMLLAMAGLLYAVVVLALLLAGAVFSLPALQSTWQDIAGWRPPRGRSPWQRWLLFYSSATLSLTFIASLVPPTAWDSLVYHLTGPRLYLAAGRVGHPLDLPYLGFPALGQMQFLLALLLWSDRAAALFHFGYGLLALILTVALARRAFGEEAAWYAAALLLSVPTISSLMRIPYVDISLLFYTTAAFYLFSRWRDAYQASKPERGWLVLVGLMLGFAGGLKYTAVATPIALALSMLWVGRQTGAVPALRRVLLVAAVAVVTVAIWPLENWLTTGNPVYPFFFDDTLYWNEWRGWWYDRPGTGLATTGPWRLLIAPLEATIAGSEGSALYEATLGPLLLLSMGLVPFIWRAWSERGRRLAGHMLLFIALNYLFWLYGVARTALLFQTRLLFPVFGVIAALGGGALGHAHVLRRPHLDVTWLLRVVVAGSLALLLFTHLLNFLEQAPLRVVVGLEPPEAYEERQLGIYPQVMGALNRLPRNSRVVFLWEPRSYACRAVECWPDALLDRFLRHTQYLEQDAAAIAADWRGQGFTHVLFYEHGMQFIGEASFDPLGPADLAVLAALQADYLETVETWDDAYTLYRLRP